MAGRYWSEKEICKLVDLYSKSSKETLIREFPNRTWDSIKLKANSLDLPFYSDSKPHPYVQADLSLLLEEVPISYYWAGFLMADGSCYGNRLKLTLAKKDKDHICKFASYIKCPNHHNSSNGSYELQIQDQLYVPLFRKKFDWKDRKTYHPPEIKHITGDLFVCWFIGYVDGDGSIGYQSGGRKDCQLRLKLHKSWKLTLTQMSENLFGLLKIEPRPVTIDSNGYANLTIARQEVLKFLKKKAQAMGLPVMSRKWDKIV